MARVIEVILILCAFTKSIWLGIFTLAYVVYSEGEHKKIKNKLEMCLFRLRVVREEFSLAEKEEEGLIKKLDEHTPERLHLYRGCVIEEYQSHFRLMEPSGKTVKRVFYSLAKAKKVANLIGNTEDENL